MADNLEPIELKFVMNSPELLAEFQKVMGTVKNYDASIAASKKGFSEFVADQLRAINALDQNARLTEKQAVALQRHADTLEYLHGKMQETFDPTQLGVYEYQLQQTQKAIDAIVEAANKNVQLMSPQELETANQKLEQALNLMDKISDTQISANIASPEELEVLSNEINKTEDGFQQLATVIDFVKAKMSGMDAGSDEFQQLETDIAAANDLLGRTPQLYDATGNSINQMTDALKTFQEQLAGETNPENIKVLNQNIETLETGIQAVKNAGKSGFDEFGNKIVEQKEKTVNLQTELENLVNSMAKLRMANKENSTEYEELKTKAIETRSAIVLTNNEIGNGVKNTANLQGLVNITQNIAAGYGMLNGAIGLFNSNEEQSQQIIQKVTSAIAVLQSLQQIHVALNTKDAATTAVTTTAKNMLSAASLRLAASLGISQLAAQALIATLTLGLSVAITAIIIAFDHFSQRQKDAAALNQKVADSVAEPIMQYRKLKEEWNALGNDLKAKEKFITDNANEFSKLGISVDNVAAAENIFIKKTAAMETALMQRAKAAAAMQLATENYKKYLEAQQEGQDDQNTLKNGSFLERSFVSLKVNSRFTTISDQIDDAQKKADKFFKTSLDYEKQSDKTLSKSGIKKASGSGSKNFEYSDAIKAEEKRLEVAKARNGTADKLERDLYNKKLAYAKNDKVEFEKITQQKAVFEASILRKQDDAAKQSSDKRQREAEAAAKKAQRLAEQAAEARKKVQEKITAAEDNLTTKETEGDEIAAIKKRYATLRAEAQKVGLGKSDIMRIDIAEGKETSTKKYELETKDLLKNLSEQKELYAAYESIKTKVGEEEAKKRYNINVNEFGTFAQLLDAEIKKLTDKQQRSFEENERLKALQSQKTDYDTDQGKLDDNKYAEAYQAAITHREQLEGINRQYDQRALQLQNVTDANLRAAKLAENEKQRQEAIDSANAEAYQKSEVYQRLSENLVGITKRELAQKIIALQAFLAQAKNLSPEQKAKIETNLNSLKSMQAESNIGVYQNALLERKKQLIASIQSDAPKSVEQAIDEQEELAKVNEELKKSVALRAQMIADGASQLAGGFHDMASAIGDSNEGLADTLDTAGDLLDVASSAAGAFASFASGDIIGGITGVMKTISGIFKIGKKARESEKKAQEEIKKRQEEQFQAQLDYNATLRQRLIAEVKINDLYKSRVDNIREEMAARKKASEDNLKDQQRLFNKLLGMQTVVGQYTEKYGGFLGIGKKTRVVDINQGISSILGVGAGTQITDELFEKLEKLNSEQPLTGDAKTAYEQLVKLRDEYGSIADAQAELEKQLKDAVTGTTAQSLADSIKEGLASGKKTFADFADDIEGFLRNAILSGISAKAIEPKIQELQDALFGMMDDGVLSQDDVDKFRQMYMAIVQQSEDMMGMINEAGIDLTSGSSSSNSLAGAYKAASQESIDLLSGNTAGLRLAALEGNNIAKNGFAQMLERSSKMIELQIDIEANTRRTADNTEKLYDVNDNVVKVADGQQKYYKALQAAGIIH